YGNMFSTIGLGAGDTAKMSKQMVQLAGDMASFHDQDPTEMLDKLRSGLSGEAEPLRRFGVLISEAAVKAEAYRKGIAKQGADLTEAQKVQARYALIMEQTTKAQGDFARTGDSVANQQRTVAAETQNLAAAFGQALLPAAKAFLGIVQALMGVLGGNQKVLSILIGVVAGLAAAVLVVNAATAAWTALQTVLNVVLAANPIGIVIVAVAALVAAFILAYKTSDTFRRVVDSAFDAVLGAAKAVFNWLKSNWPLLLGILTGPFGLMVAIIVRNWDAIEDAARTAVSAVKSALNGLAQWISGFAHGVLAAALNAAGNVFDAIAGGARDAYASVQRNLNGIVSFIEGIIGKVSHAASSVANAIKSPINAVLTAWNSISLTIPTIKIPSIKVGKKKIGGGSFGGQTIGFPNVPLLAQGGVVSAPTLAMIGEGQGREIVAPEALLREIAGERPIEVRVFIGDTELTSLVRTEIVSANTGLARALLAG
ncbi:MAG TPA: hypothetical protein VJN72_08050, partial [Gaiellales bacterium]|nr:hypothetical protein [Gaiellales bacterium]